MSNTYIPRYTAGVRMILDVLAASEGPVWGKRIIYLTRMQSGSVYPALARLEKAGWIKGYWEDAGAGLGRPARHYYEITAEGKSRREAESARLNAISGKIVAPAGVADEQPGGSLPTALLDGPWAVPFRPAV